MKVDEQYGPIKTNILMLPELPIVSTAYRMLQQEQRHKELSKLNAAHNDPVTFFVHKRTYHDKQQQHNKHYKQTSADSYTKTPFGNDSKRVSTYFLSHCKIVGHSVERCFKLNGYPPGFKHKKFVGCV